MALKLTRDDIERIQFVKGTKGVELVLDTIDADWIKETLAQEKKSPSPIIETEGEEENAIS